MVSAYIRDIIAETKNETKTIRDEIKQLREEVDAQTKLKTAKMHEFAKIDNPAELEDYKNTLFYNIKNKCGKKINDRADLNRVIQSHPAIFKIEQEMASAEKNILQLENTISLHIIASKNRIKNIKQL
jgi:hypothetical protein